MGISWSNHHGAMAKRSHVAPCASTTGWCCLCPTAVVCVDMYPGEPSRLPQAPFGGLAAPGGQYLLLALPKSQGGIPAHGNWGLWLGQSVTAAPSYQPCCLPGTLSRQWGDAGFWALACRGGWGRAGSQPLPFLGNSPGPLPWALFFFQGFKTFLQLSF